MGPKGDRGDPGPPGYGEKVKSTLYVTLNLAALIISVIEYLLSWCSVFRVKKGSQAWLLALMEIF